MKVKVKVKSPSCVQLLAAPWTAAYQAPPSTEFSRQEYWKEEWGAIAFSTSAVKALKNTRNKMKLLLYKTMYEKPIANIISDTEKLKFFL